MDASNFNSTAGSRLPSEAYVSLSQSLKNSSLRSPQLVLKTIDESDSCSTKNYFSVGEGMLVSPYSLEELRNDCKGDGIWEIRYKKISCQKVLDEFQTVLNLAHLQQTTLQDINSEIASIGKDLQRFEKVHTVAGEALKLLKFRFEECLMNINFALTCNKSALFLVCCLFNENLMKIVLHSDLKKLHIEQSPVTKDTIMTFAKELPNTRNCLTQLHFIDVVLDPSAVHYLAKGITAQSKSQPGITDLAFVRCSLNEKHAAVLNALVAHSRHLKVLDLEGNYLGSASKTKSKALLSTVSGEDSAMRKLLEQQQQDKCLYEPLLNCVEPRPLSSRVSRTLWPAGKQSAAMTLLAEGVISNRERGGNLQLIILADNKLRAKDIEALLAKEDHFGCSQVKFNVAKNGLEIASNKPRLLFGPPCSSAFTTNRKG